MSGPMDAWDEALRETNRADDAVRRAEAAESEVARLTADRDLHCKRADDAETLVGEQADALSRARAVRDNAITVAAQGLLDEGEPMGLRARVLDLAAKWRAVGGTGNDKRSTAYRACGRELRSAATLPPAPSPLAPHPDSFRARTIEAERMRDLYQAKLRDIMGTGFELWLAQLDEIQF